MNMPMECKKKEEKDGRFGVLVALLLETMDLMDI